MLKPKEYLITSWQGFIQQLTNLMAHGYIYYYVTTFPERKREKWALSDRKLMSLYPVASSKDIRYRRKKAGMANYAYLRYDCHAVIMHTSGAADLSEHTFVDFRERALEVRLNADSEITLKIGKDAVGITVYLTKSCYRDIKARIMESIEKRSITKVIHLFNALNGLPAYSGIIRQRKALLADIKQAAKQHHIAVNKEDFVLRIKRTSVKVHS